MCCLSYYRHLLLFSGMYKVLACDASQENCRAWRLSSWQVEGKLIVVYKPISFCVTPKYKGWILKNIYICCVPAFWILYYQVWIRLGMLANVHCDDVINISITGIYSHVLAHSFQLIFTDGTRPTKQQCDNTTTIVGASNNWVILRLVSFTYKSVSYSRKDFRRLRLTVSRGLMYLR